MTLKPRTHGCPFPDQDEEDRVLADFTPTDREHEHAGAEGWDYERTLGDLIVDVLVGRDLNDDGPFAPKEWESLEHGFMLQVARDLRAVTHARAVPNLSTDDGITEDFTEDDAQRSLRAISRRLVAGAELCKRLRSARWGHPSFGGGENYANTAEKSEAAE